MSKTASFRGVPLKLGKPIIACSFCGVERTRDVVVTKVIETNLHVCHKCLVKTFKDITP